MRRPPILFALTVAAFAWSGPPSRDALDAARRNAERARRELRRTRTASTDAGEQLRRVQGDEAAAAATLARVESNLAGERARASRLAAEVARARRRFEARQIAVGRRLRAMYLSGSPPAVLTLLSASSLGDLAARRDLLRRIADADRRDLDALERARRYFALREAQSRASVARVRSLKARGETYAAGLAGARRAKESVIARLQTRSEALSAAIAEFDADERRIAEEIAVYARRAAAARRAATAAARRRANEGRTPSRPPDSGALSFSGAFGAPADGPRTSGFGMRFHPILKVNRMHKGLDYGGGYGAPVRAAAAGTVVAARTMGSYGLVVILDHGDGVSTIYAHMSATAVGEGERVTRGQRIGSIGSSGLSTGPHLHFEALRGGRRVDPAGFFSAKL